MTLTALSNKVSLRKLATILSTFSIMFFFVIAAAHAADSMKMGGMFTKVTVSNNNKPVSGALVIIQNQSRTTDNNGVATFENLEQGQYTGQLIINHKTYKKVVTVAHDDIILSVPLFTEFEYNAIYSLLITIIILGVIIAAYNYMQNQKKGFFWKKKKRSPVIFFSLVGILIFTIIYVFVDKKDTLKSRFAAANKAQESFAAETVSSSLPQPQNVKVFADDRVATVRWDAPANASSNKIVGYLVRWGDKSVGTLTDFKQTIHTITQIQPLDIGKSYTVTVQSVQGSYTNKASWYDSSTTDQYAVANGTVSSAVTTTVTTSSARVDAMRSRLTAFFDDFNTSAGGFDETKWNFGQTACVEVGEAGQFINSQFHSHNQTQSSCDRDGNVSRPRAIFDITNRTETDPGIIEFDMDGANQPRDTWYLDIIAADDRKNGIPIDVTGHPSDDGGDDPGRMIRVTQGNGALSILYYDENKSVHQMPILASGQPCDIWWMGNTTAAFDACNSSSKVTSLSPLPMITHDLNPVANVRRYWRIEMSKDRIKVFIDGTLIANAATPTLFKSINRYQIHNTLFSYNTGKQYDTVDPSTSMVHWDNFGFNGPAPTTVTHNYLDGGADGTFPMVALGTKSHPLPTGNRTTKIPVPDPIGSPVGQARLMFTIQPRGYHDYIWSSSHNVVVNGHKYDYPNPALNVQSAINPIASTYVAHSTGIYINASDLVQGMNTIQLNLGEDIHNLHLEIDYSKTNAPPFTQPRNIFPNLNEAIMPAMRPNDNYWFVEQKMGLENILTPAPQPPGPVSIPIKTGTPVPVPTSTPIVTPTKTPIAATATPKPVATPTKTPAPTASPVATATPSVVSSTKSVIKIYAAGQPAGGVYPTMVLNILENGTRSNVMTFTNINGNANTSSFKEYTYTHLRKVSASQIRVRFTNDSYTPGGEDRNIRINRINVDGIDYMSANPNTYSVGSWNSSTGCNGGYKNSDWLMCQGYFDYSKTSASGAVPPTNTPIPVKTATPIPVKTATPAPVSTGGSNTYFTTLAVGATLPSDAYCTANVKHRTENKRMNTTYNSTRGNQKLGSSFLAGDPRANTQIASRVTGDFVGTTDEILQWAACKWGIDEDIVRAQAAKESWWQQTAKGDWTSDASRCAPGHGLGVDGQSGQCPESFGILQNRYPYEQTSWPGIYNSTAFNADTTYAIWRACYEGYEWWLNDVDKGKTYSSGDAWGCVGRWFAGRWYTTEANTYVTAVKSNLSSRIWEQASFQEP